MELTALVQHPEHVCCRYRIEAFRPALEAAGHTLRTVEIPRCWWARWRLFRQLRGANVILQRRLLPFWELLLLRNSVERLILDIDDAVFLRDSYSPRGLYHAARRRRFAALARRCNAILAGNAWLAEQARRTGTQAPVVVLPTCVNPDGYSPRSHLRIAALNAPVTLVWVGSSSTLQGIERIRPLLETIGRELPGVSLKIVCDRFPEFTHLPVIRVPWQEATEAAEIAAADIGISWIPDDDWSRGKCGLKILQYMAAGLAVVANPVGVHPAMVLPGKTGFLASTDSEWLVALRTLVAEPRLRIRMGQAGRHHLEQTYSVKAGALIWQRLLGTLQSARRQAA